MQSSHIGCRVWVVVIYLITTSLKSVSGMKLHRDRGNTQKRAWLMVEKIRETLDDKTHEWFDSQVEVDKTYLGGKEETNNKSKKLNTARGTIGKTAVLGVKERDTNKVSVSSLDVTDSFNSKRHISDSAKPEAMPYTESVSAIEGVNEKHKTVNDFVGQYVEQKAHTSGIENYLTLLKRGYFGIIHKISVKHLVRHLNEFAGRHNIRSQKIIAQMNLITLCTESEQLT